MFGLFLHGEYICTRFKSHRYVRLVQSIQYSPERCLPDNGVGYRHGGDTRQSPPCQDVGMDYGAHFPPHHRIGVLLFLRTECPQGASHQQAQLHPHCPQAVARILAQAPTRPS